jgi:hypothetical protein
MIDSIIVPPTVHILTGQLVLLTTLLSTIVTLLLAVRRQSPGGRTRALLVATQLVLMVQALIGIKLLDQGAGPLQLYIHYVGGLAPLLFFLLFYWFPLRNERLQRWVLPVVTAASFLFAVMAYFIGQGFVRGTL